MDLGRSETRPCPSLLNIRWQRRLPCRPAGLSARPIKQACLVTEIIRCYNCRCGDGRPQNALAGGSGMQDRITIGGIMRNDRLARISVLSVPDRPGVAAALLEALGARGLNVQFIVQCIDPQERDHLVLCVDRQDMAASMMAVKEAMPRLEAGSVHCDPDAGSIAIFGPDFRERPGIAAAMFTALASVGINIHAISTSISTVTCILNSHDVDVAETALRARFVLP